MLAIQHAVLDADEPREDQGGSKLQGKQLLDAVDRTVRDPDQPCVMTHCKTCIPCNPEDHEIWSRPQARHWCSHKMASEVDELFAIVENQS
jgi:hypothetical protein